MFSNLIVFCLFPYYSFSICSLLSETRFLLFGSLLCLDVFGRDFLVGRNAENLEIDSEISTDYNWHIIRVVGKMGETSDKLVVQAKLGDQEALCALLDLFSDQVASRLEKQINKKWKAALDIEDVLQVTYIEVFLQIGNFNGEEEKTFLAWLVRIAENNLRDAIRSLQCEKRPPPDKRVHAPSGQDSHITLIELVAGSSVTASRKAGRNEACDLLDAALRKLRMITKKYFVFMIWKDSPGLRSLRRWVEDEGRYICFVPGRWSGWEIYWDRNLDFLRTSRDFSAVFIASQDGKRSP